MNFADRVNRFNDNLHYEGDLPAGIRIMNPYRESPLAMDISRKFYQKYFSDNNSRKIILGINPGRHGAGTTGIPFTDTIRLEEKCGIRVETLRTHEPSSSFIYDMIDAYGGVQKFYGDFFLSAVCPLGFTTAGKKTEINYNYYDSPRLIKLTGPFILKSLREQISLGIDTSVCYCLGTGKNENYIRKLNEEFGFFGKVIALEHPRFIMQYRSRRKQEFIDKYVYLLRSPNN